MLWARTYWASDHVEWSGSRDAAWAGTARGSFILGAAAAGPGPAVSRPGAFRYSHDVAMPPFNMLIFLSPEPGQLTTAGDFAGFHWFFARVPGLGSNHWQVIVPWWLLLVLNAAPAVAFAVTRRRPMRRALPGRCPGCGYDLRATPERCPECGISTLIDASPEN